MSDHDHIFVMALVKYSPGKIAEVSKSTSSKVMFDKFPLLVRDLCAREFFSDGYFARRVTNRVTSGLIRRYIRYQHP